MAAKASNIIVGAAKVYTSYGANTYRPDLSSSATFPWNVNVGSSTAAGGSSGSISTPAFLESTASMYWRDLGFTSTGVDISYEPGYSDVVVDQLLDAARLFQQSLKVVIKTELDEGSFENMNFVWGQQEVILNAGSGNASVSTLSTPSSTLPTSASMGAAVNQLNIAAGALGITPIERSLVFIGNAPGTLGQAVSYPTSAASATVNTNNAQDVSAYRKKERVYVARRIIQEQTTAHALKRDAATVFPVSFRALPDSDRNAAAGSEYGFVIDRVYGNS